jgi:hypothetical protein
MKKNLFPLLTALFAIASALAQDTIVFKNGDVLTGKILKQDSGYVHFKSGAFGSVSLSTRDIAEIKIATEEFGEVAVPAEAIAAPEPAKPADETLEAQIKPSENRDWTGQAGLAIAMRESNTLRRYGDEMVERDQSFESYRVYGNVNWEGERNNVKWDWTYRYSETDLRKEDDYFNLTQDYQHDFTKIYYTSAKTIYQKDYRRGIESEYLQTAEMGVNWINTPTLQFSVSAGGGYHQYDRTQSEYSEAQGKLVFDQSLRWQLINSLTLFQKYTHLGNLDKYHFVFTSGLENKLIRDIFLRMEYRLDRDTEVNYNDSGYYDKALLTSLLYKF